MISKKDIYSRLQKVLDPELHVSIVDMGLIYDVSVSNVQTQSGTRTKVHILMTLTTPGCPLAGMFDRMLKDALIGLDSLDPDKDVTIELTFDPPWVIDMMDPETRANLGF